jgi:AraC family transcriptional regulator
MERPQMNMLRPLFRIDEPCRRETRVAGEAKILPNVIAEIAAGDALIQILEWHWTESASHTVVEKALMIELPLPPWPSRAIASFPTVAPGTQFTLGSLFVRFPGLAIQTDSAAGTFRLLRVTLSEGKQRDLLGGRHAPSLAMLETLLNVRSVALRMVMRQLVREVESPGPDSVAAAKALVNLLEIELKRMLDQDPEPSAGGRLAPWQFKRICARLEAAGERPSVAELAAICGISVRHLHRQFYNLTGLTVSDYVASTMVTRTKGMLASTSLSIGQIARQNGFEHSNSFSRAFRRAAGMTPKQFRQLASSRLASDLCAG